MGKKPETSFKERLLPKLKAIENSWWVKTDLKSYRGIPDIIGCVNGYFVALELKRARNAEPDRLQAWELECIRRAGGFQAVVYPENMQLVIIKIEELNEL